MNEDLYLLTLADQLIEIKTICHCGSKAIMNMRIDEFGNMVKSGDQVEIGGNDRYTSTCRNPLMSTDQRVYFPVRGLI